jgi:four helix bundle protein
MAFEEDDKMEKTEKQVTFFRFEDLRVYHKALDYANWLLEISYLFPDNDKTQLVEKLNESARNIALFIAEGSSRNKSQFVYYLKMAKSAIRECLVFTSLAYNANHMSEASEEESRGQLMEMTKMIGALITSLQRAPGYENGNEYNGNGNGYPKSRYDNHSAQFDEDELSGNY